MINNKNFIDTKTGKLAWIKGIGFCLLFAGLIAIMLVSFLNPEITKPFNTPSIIAISFFITMLGFVFVFPDLLRDQNKGLSTMRITVFMMTNVICMLLLKIGWANDIKSLGAIGLDQWWMGVIAFTFGAKATQSYFESKMAVPTVNQAQVKPTQNIDNLPIASANIITEAIKLKGKDWVNSFPNVTGFSVGNKTLNGKQSDIPALIFKVVNKKQDLDFGNVPPFIVYKAKDGKDYKIQTDVIQESIPVAHVGIVKDNQPFPLGNSVSRQDINSTGSIGLVLKKDGDFNNDYLISCYHVFCSPELKNNNKTFQSQDNSAKLMCASSEDNGTNYVGYVIDGCMKEDTDFAIAKLAEGVVVDNGKLTFGVIPQSFGYIFPENKGDILTVCGRTSGVKTGAIKSHYSSQTISYFQNTISQYMEGLIEVEKFSEGGDSGGVVLNADNKIIGLVVAGNNQSSYVLPVENYLVNNNYSLKI